MNDCVGRPRYAFDADLPIRRMKQGEQFGCAVAAVFMRLLKGMTVSFPTPTGIGFGLAGSGFIFTPHT
jgi:hypothetical protein